MQIKDKIICGFVNRRRENWLATLHGSLFVACQCQGALVPGLEPNRSGPWRARTKTTVPPAPEGLPRKLMRTIGMHLLQFPSVMWIPPWEGLSGHLASGEAESIEVDSSFQPIRHQGCLHVHMPIPSSTQLGRLEENLQTYARRHVSCIYARAFQPHRCLCRWSHR